jgi:hypothetical protein
MRNGLDLPNFGAIRGMLYQGNSFYDALKLQVTKQMSHGVQVQGAYTWAKSIDTNSATVAGNQFGNSISSLDGSIKKRAVLYPISMLVEPW